MGASVATPGKYLEHLPAGRFVHVDGLPGSRAAASCAASRACKRGELLPVRKGLYWKGARSGYGMVPPPPESIALEVLGREGVGPTGHSAAAAFGLTTQVPPMPSLTVAGPVPRPVTGVHLSRRNNMRRRSLTYHEIALLELLRNWESLTDGDWDELVSAVRKAVRKSQVRIAAIRSALAGERSPVVRVTFEWLARDITSNGAAPEPAQ